MASTIPAHLLLLDLPAFVDGSYSTRTVEEGALDPLAAGPAGGAPAAGAGRRAIVVVNGAPARLWNPAVASSISSAGAGADGSATVSAPMHGTILQVLVAEGDRVDAGDPVAILEAMKMETVVAASTAGRVEDVRVVAGAVVESSEVIAVVAAERAPETP